MDGVSNNKTIAKNTIYLYFRMMFTMIVALYTSRVILEVLGVEDYGIYQTVGGVVALLSFVNGALSTGSSRFLMYELGTGNQEKLSRTFSSVMTAHVILALIILIVAETLGLWFVYNKLIIPSERLDAVVFAYHVSILTAIITITQVPYNSAIIAHERMSIYAYFSIVDCLLKLGICFLLKIGGFDKLIMYSILLFVVTTCIAIFYRWYSTRSFVEVKFKLSWDKEILSGIIGYSSWNLLSNTAIALTTQGVTILINMFFTPAVVAAQSLASQVNLAANQFINNFRTAANPQIVKKYAAHDYEGSKKLLLASTKFSYCLMLLLALPIYLVADDLLQIWLKEVPEYTSVFLKFAVVTSLFQVFDTSFYTALFAKGRIRENAIISPMVLCLVFPIVYFLYKTGYSPVVVSIVLMVAYAILSLLVKPVLIIRIVDYKWKDIIEVFIPCLKVTLIACPLPIIAYMNREMLFTSMWGRFIGLVSVSVICVLLTVWWCGMNRDMRGKIVSFLTNKINK